MSSLMASIEEHQAVIESLRDKLQPIILDCALRLRTILGSGGKVLICGNGGSAADSQHFAAELVGRFEAERGGLPAIALTTDTSILTAVGNDYDFSRVFARQVEALAAPGDALIGISTSGNSENVLAAVHAAAKIGCTTFGLTGRDGGSIAEAVNLAITVPVARTARIQEAHLLIVHLLCEQIDQGVIKE